MSDRARHVPRDAAVPGRRPGGAGRHPAAAQPGPRDRHDPGQAGRGGGRGRRLGGAAAAGGRDQGRHPGPPRRAPAHPRGGADGRGATVHWARDAADACAVVADVAKAHGIREVVKVKSMATQEIELNEALAAQGISAWETDLAELIVQLGDDLPSHILVPAIHRNRSEIRDIFRERMAGAGRPAPEGLTDDPARAGVGRAAAPAREVPVDPDGRLRRELRRGGDGHARRGGVRGQRADVPDPARGARDGGRHREAGADLGRPRRVPAPAPALARPGSG